MSTNAHTWELGAAEFHIVYSVFSVKRKKSQQLSVRKENEILDIFKKEANSGD